MYSCGKPLIQDRLFQLGMWYSGSVGSSRAIEKLMYSWSQRLDYYLSSDLCYSVCWQTKLTPEKISQALFLLATKLPDLLVLFFYFLLSILSVLYFDHLLRVMWLFSYFNFFFFSGKMNSGLKSLISIIIIIKKKKQKQNKTPHLQKPLNSVDPCG